MSSGVRLTTARLLLRPPEEADRDRFVELFMDPDFMVYSGNSIDQSSANERFDRLLADTAVAAFSKRPIVERSSGVIVGYTGVAPFEYDGERWFEYGYRLCTAARGKGYATEAGRALLIAARAHFRGQIMAMIDPTNRASSNVITKLGFEFWHQAVIHGDATNLYRYEIA